jgi:hypothetical protein
LHNCPICCYGTIGLCQAELRQAPFEPVRRARGEEADEAGRALKGQHRRDRLLPSSSHQVQGPRCVLLPLHPSVISTLHTSMPLTLSRLSVLSALTLHAEQAQRWSSSRSVSSSPPFRPSWSSPRTSPRPTRYAAAIPMESIVLVEGEVKAPFEEVKSASVSDAEVVIRKVSRVVSYGLRGRSMES